MKLRHQLQAARRCGSRYVRHSQSAFHMIRGSLHGLAVGCAFVYQVACDGYSYTTRLLTQRLSILCTLAQACPNHKLQKCTHCNTSPRSQRGELVLSAI